MSETTEISCQCECGQSQINLTKPPMIRFHCHCTICQSFYSKPFSDVTVMWANNVSLNKVDKVEYSRPGLLLKRGACTECQQPILAYMTILPGVRLAFVPGNRYDDQSILPKASAHIFYHRSQHELDDGIGKYKGFIRSELMISWLILKSAVLQVLGKQGGY